MARERMLLDVCKRCGGWRSIGSTIDEPDATEHATTVTLRIASDHSLGEYADPRVGGCRCPDDVHPPIEPAKAAEHVRWLAWYEALLPRTWCY